jgi:hypothetical protein
MVVNFSREYVKMYLSKSFVRVNKLSISIFIFLCLFSLIHIAKPALLYTPEGGFRQFGVGYKQKTVIPIWIAAIVLAIFSYLAVLYYLLMG